MNETDEALLDEANAAVTTPTVTTEVGVAPIETRPASADWWSTSNAMTMCGVILLFGLIVLSLSAWLIRSGQQASAVLRVFGTILVIVMATFLVVAGYDDKQIGAPLGLLGTIVGYLLGRDPSPRAESVTPRESRSEG